jgi:hypothetical protein
LKNTFYSKLSAQMVDYGPQNGKRGPNYCINPGYFDSKSEYSNRLLGEATLEPI